MKRQYDEKEIAERLKKVLGENIVDTVEIYGVLNHTSKSGMFRRISLFVVRHNEPICIAREEGTSGCGMDMGFEMAYNVFCEAYPKLPYQKYLYFKWL